MNFIDRIVDIIIRPLRDKYPISRLGNPKFSIKSRNNSEQQLAVERQDISLYTHDKKRIEVSYFNLKEKQGVRKPCVVYLHGNSGSRCEGNAYTKNVLEREMQFLVFDFIGSGGSEGEYVTLGIEESKNISVIIDYIRKNKNVNDIFLWGRSMGAVASLIYLSENPYKIQGAVFDSPFSSLTQLICELANQKTGVPKFLFNSLIPYISKEVEKKTGIGIQDLQISQMVDRIQGCPGLFITSQKDKLVHCSHIEDLFSKYNGPKKIQYIDFEHHEFRSINVTDKILDFFENNSFVNSKPKVDAISFIQILDDCRRESDEAELRSNNTKISLAELLRQNPIEKNQVKTSVKLPIVYENVPRR